METILHALYGIGAFFSVLAVLAATYLYLTDKRDMQMYFVIAMAPQFRVAKSSAKYVFMSLTITAIFFPLHFYSDFTKTSAIIYFAALAITYKQIDVLTTTFQDEEEVMKAVNAAVALRDASYDRYFDKLVGMVARTTQLVRTWMDR